MQPVRLADRLTVSGRPLAALPAVGLTVLLLVYVLGLARLLPVGGDGLALVAVFSTDEALSGRIVRSMLEGRTLNPDHFFSYGALYHELAAVVAVPFHVAHGDE